MGVKNKQDTMRKLITPYECGFCKIKFRNPLFLIRHVELRHPRTSEQFSPLPSDNIKDTKANIFSDSKDSNDFENVFEFVSTSVKETDSGYDISKLQGRRQHGCSGCICTRQFPATGALHPS